METESEERNEKGLNKSEQSQGTCGTCGKPISRTTCALWDS